MKGSSSREPPSTPAPPQPGSTSCEVLAMRFRDALAGPGLQRSPRSSGARPRSATSAPTPTPHGSPATTSGRRRRGLRPRRRTLRWHLGRPPSGAREHRHAAAREGLLLHRGAPSDGERGRRRRRPDPARDLDDDAVRSLMQLAGDLGLDTLVEAHDAGELERAVIVGAPVIGVNARDLSTFEIDRTSSSRSSRGSPPTGSRSPRVASTRAPRAPPRSSPGPTRSLSARR